jgi:hypothetical protein
VKHFDEYRGTLHVDRHRGQTATWLVPPITYYRTVSLILDHSYLVGKSTSSKIADRNVSGF